MINFEIFETGIIDKSYDGILGILVKSEHSDYEIVIYPVYLPPENSPWGGNATDFCSHLLGQVYLSSGKDGIRICGDLNSCLTLFQILMECRVEMPLIINNNVNQHGHSFIDFSVD